MKIYEWLDERHKGEVTGWPRLQPAQRAKLEAKLDMLSNAEVDPNTKQADLPPQLLVGPGYDGQPFIYKLKVHGNVALRPMICLGPLSDGEWTVLCRAAEKDNVLTPANAAEIAEQRRQQIRADSTRRALLVNDDED